MINFDEVFNILDKTKKIDLKIKLLELEIYFWVIRYKNEYYFAIPKKEK